MPQDIVRLKGMAGKTVDEVTVTNESDFRNLSIRFTDQTALDFGFSMTLSIDPELVDWKTGNRRRIRKFPVIFERAWIE